MKDIDKNNKIRIVSFQNAHNFGAVCQAYGLQQTLLDMGYTDVKFYNYNPQYLKDRYDPFKLWKHPNYNVSILHKITRFIRWCSAILGTYYRNAKFKSSIKRLLHQTDKEWCQVKDFANEEADVLICGSDQIWNIALTKVLDPVFFGLALKKTGKVIAYAPSTEISSLSDSVLQNIAKFTAHFSSISLREQSVKEKLQPVIAQPIEVCVDPTILCSKETYDEIASHNLVKVPYICVYAYYPDEEIVQEVIKTIPNYEQYEVHYISFTAANMNKWRDKSYHFAISIEDFISYFKYASYVVTNSFHGLAFSLMFEKNFMVTWMDKVSTRSESLLKNVELSNRMIHNASEAVWNDVDYTRVNNALNKLRNHSREFLIHSLA